MMKCYDCGSVFEDSEVIFEEWDEPREFWGAPCMEHFVKLRCPYCNSDDIMENYIEEGE